MRGDRSHAEISRARNIGARSRKQHFPSWNLLYRMKIQPPKEDSAFKGRRCQLTRLLTSPCKAAIGIPSELIHVDATFGLVQSRCQTNSWLTGRCNIGSLSLKESIILFAVDATLEEALVQWSHGPEVVITINWEFTSLFSSRPGLSRRKDCSYGGPAHSLVILSPAQLGDLKSWNTITPLPNLNGTVAAGMSAFSRAVKQETVRTNFQGHKNSDKIYCRKANGAIMKEFQLLLYIKASPIYIETKGQIFVAISPAWMP